MNKTKELYAVQSLTSKNRNRALARGTSLLVSVEHLCILPERFGKKRPMNSKFDYCVSQKDVTS